MAVTIRGTTQDGNNSATQSLTRQPNSPAGTQPGDLLLLAGCFSGGNTSAIQDPVGWTNIYKPPTSLQTNDNLVLYARRADGSAADSPTLTIASTAETFVATCISLGGWNGVLPAATATAAVKLGGAASTTITYPAITPNTASDLLVYFTGLRPTGSTIQVSAVQPSGGGGTGGSITTQTDACSNVSGQSDSEQAVMTQQLTAVTAVTQQTATVATTVSSVIAAVTISPASNWALVQQLAAQATGVTSASLPTASAAGNLLLAVVGGGNSSGAITPPAGWATIQSAVNSTLAQVTVFAYFANPGGLTTFAFTGGPATYIVSLAEFTCNNVAQVTTASDTGTNTAGAVSSAVTVTTNGTSRPGDLVIGAAFQHISSASAITWTDPSGFTEFATLKLASSTNHEYGAFALSAAAGGAQSVTMTASVPATGGGWAGVAATFSLPPPPAQAAAPGRTWLRRFQHRQAPAAPVPSAVTNPLTLTATVTAAGSQSAQTGKLLTGTATAAGALSSQAGKLLTATVTAAGALARQVGKLLPGSSAATGSQSVQAGKQLAATATASGTLTRALARTLTTTATAAGSLTRAIGRTLAGGATAAGTVLRGIGKLLSAAVSAVGTLILPTLPPHVARAQVTITPAGPLAASVATARIIPTQYVTITAAGPLAVTVAVTWNTGAAVELTSGVFSAVPGLAVPGLFTPGLPPTYPLPSLPAGAVTITPAGAQAATVTIAEPPS